MIKSRKRSRKVSLITEKELKNSHISLGDEKWYTVGLLLVTITAFCTRFYAINYPDEVVFDEVHFGKFASYYLERTYFFDLHPPFAKLLIAFVGFLAGYNGEFKFTTIGESYIKNEVPYVVYRSLSAVQGSLTVPIVYLCLKECGYTVLTCVFGACIILFDGAHIAETRLILLDATLIFFVSLSIYSYIKFTKRRSEPFGQKWWKWLFFTGVSLSCVISTKYVGVFTYLTIGCGVLFDLWSLVDYKKGYSLAYVGKHFAARFFLLILVPFLIYLNWFYVHFAILSKSGPGDSFMSSEFQETLGDSPLAAFAKEVHFNDIITIKHKETDAMLHSHLANYPLRYEDGRVSSQGQQVTAYSGEDPNNNWQIISPEGLTGVVTQGDVVRLRHVGTDGYLLTHDVASPFYPTNEEFTVVGQEKATQRWNETLFRIDPYDKKKNRPLKSKASFFKLIHVPTVVAMWTHNDQLLPDWGFNQQEVNGNKKLADESNLWVVDNIVDIAEDDPRKHYVPKEVKNLPFLTKWLELQRLMFIQNNKLSSDHPFASDPISWPFSLSGVSFWTNNESRKQIYFVGNIPGWWMEVAALGSFLGLVFADQFTRRRNSLVLTNSARSRLYNNLGFFFVGWCCHYLPFFLMSRQKFLHHYLPAHLIAAMFTAGFLEFIFTDNRTEEFKDQKSSCEPNSNSSKPKEQLILWLSFSSFVALLLSIIVWTFFFFAPLTYGNTALSAEEVQQRQWLDMKLQFAK
ncbi:hypothetical protein LJB42_002383 [Komagataella kurtzmanii]|nr:hypothetical protein LJB42_002383 [Komagataella kurtzmanii]